MISHWQVYRDGDRWSGKLVINGVTVLRLEVANDKDSIRRTIARVKRCAEQAMVREED